MHLQGWPLKFKTYPGRERKDKVPDLSHSYGNIGTSYNSELKLQKLKRCVYQKYRKTT